MGIPIFSSLCLVSGNFPPKVREISLVFFRVHWEFPIFSSLLLSQFFRCNSKPGNFQIWEQKKKGSGGGMPLIFGIGQLIQRGTLRYMSNQTWTCFVPYLKIINMFWKMIQTPWSKLSEKLKYGIKISVGQAGVIDQRTYCFDQPINLLKFWGREGEG